MDRNKIIGYSLMIALVIGYFIYTSYEQKQVMQQKQLEQTTQQANIPHQDSLTPKNTAQNTGVIPATPAPQKEELTAIETDLLKIVFTNKGGSIQQVILKKYDNLENIQDSIKYTYEPLNYFIRMASGKQVNNTCFYHLVSQKKLDNGATQIVFAYAVGEDELQHIYTVYPDSYLIDFSIVAKNNLVNIVGNDVELNFLVWNKQVERDLKYEIENSKVGFYSNDKGYDFERATKNLNYEVEYPVQWLSYNQRFFNSTIISKDGDFTQVHVLTEVPNDTALHTVGRMFGTLHKQVKGNSMAFQIFYGPNDYHILKSYKMGMENIVDMGSGVFAFVKYINRWIILPMVDFLMQYVVNIGLLIALITIIIRLITSPLLYSSYLSAAKMKVLRPDLEALKKKLGGDQQKFAMEQMNLFREAGVNPLSGCIPALLQMPIFVSLYAFFLGYIGMRGQSFWWAHDLSTYDVIWSWNIHIPVIGTHLSLFTVTTVLTSFLISFFGMMNTTPTIGDDINAKMMKYMPYIFPFILFFVFNGMPAALTWYYTVSNVITIVIQFIIQKWIISPDKIHARIQENKKKVKKKSSFQLRLEEMQKKQQQSKNIRDKYK